jgi:hypothetical protein
MTSWSWQFGPDLSGAETVIISSPVRGDSLYAVDYSEGHRVFARISGVELDEDDLAEFDRDMTRWRVTGETVPELAIALTEWVK